MFNFDNMDANRLYKPSEIKSEINKYMQTDIPYDITDLAATALAKNSKADSSEYVTSKDISKAFKTLENDILLTKIKGKEEVKSIKGKQKIEFLGKPYFYKLPPKSESLKRIISNPKVVELIFKALTELSLLPHLQFVYEASFYAVRDNVRKEKMYNLSKIAIKGIGKSDAKIDKSSWESYRDLLLPFSEGQLEIIAKKLAESTAQYPALYYFILLIALSKSP
ncbi:MAG TPA: hypothetical protein VJ225_02290 [Nitrososphaeraceae archaeon]|nr:hypothetical protein [Nitrososphaeraceae archaeon]